MDVKTINPTDRVNYQQPASSASGPIQEIQGAALAKKAQFESAAEGAGNEKKLEELSKEDLLPITKELSKFMAYLNADIQFELHDKTQQLMVRVVDTKENKVLREFPPKELLDTIANIREYVGVLLDKKA
ncbi:MAG: flagellar protein FlaG [Negativicutes bacterium]|nr:flagellar protein FlaG [Negativicutes bacterium]